MKIENEVNDLRWEDLEKPESYFINDKVTKYGVLKTNSKFSRVLSSTKQGLVILLPLLVLFGVSIVVSLTLGFPFALMFVFFGLIIYGVIINRFIFHSKRNARLLADQQRIGVYGVNRWNDIIVDKETGQMFNMTGGKRGIKSSFLILWDNSPILDNNMQAEQNLVDNEITPFITEIQNMGMDFDKRSVEVKNDLSPALLQTIVNTRNTNNQALRIKMEMQNKVYSSIELNSQQRYKTVIQVKNESRGKIFDFRNSLQSAIDSTIGSSSIMKNVHIATFDEVQEFARNESRDPELDLKNLGRNNDAVPIFNLVDIVSIIGDDGREYTYDNLVRGPVGVYDNFEHELPERRRSGNATLSRERLRNRPIPNGDKNKHKNNHRNDHHNKPQGGNWNDVDLGDL